MRVKWTGIRPLLMSNPQTVQLSNTFSAESRRLNALLKAARKKGDENKLVELEQKQARNDWQASGYYDATSNRFFVPDTVLLAVIKAGAAASKKGKDVERAVIVSETEAFVDGVPKHNSLEAYWDDPQFRLEGPCKVPPKTGALIWKVRTMLPTGWSVTFSVEFEDDIISEKSLLEAMRSAGQLCGMGGWRPKFGRFLVETV